MDRRVQFSPVQVVEKLLSAVPVLLDNVFGGKFIPIRKSSFHLQLPHNSSIVAIGLPCKLIHEYPWSWSLVVATHRKQSALDRNMEILVSLAAAA